MLWQISQCIFEPHLLHYAWNIALETFPSSKKFYSLAIKNVGGHKGSHYRFFFMALGASEHLEMRESAALEDPAVLGFHPRVIVVFCQIILDTNFEEVPFIETTSHDDTIDLSYLQGISFDLEL